MLDAKQIRFSIRVIGLAALLVLLARNLIACNKRTFSKQATITKDFLCKFYDASMQVSANRDAQGTCAQYADNAQIRTTQFTRLRSEKTTPSKVKFCYEPEDAHVQRRQPSVGNTASSMRLDGNTITSAADGRRADAISTVTETIPFAGQGAASTRAQADRTEWLGGKHAT